MAVDRGNPDDSERGWAERAEARVAVLLAALANNTGDGAHARADEDRRAGARPDILTGVRHDAEGFAFTRRLLESVAGEGDPFAAALALRAASKHLPPSLPARDRLAVRAGGLASLGLPWAVLPAAKRRLRDRVAHLVLSVRTPDDVGREGRPGELSEALAAREAAGFETVLLAGGEPVLGPAGARAELARLTALAAEPGVTRLAVDPARIAPGSDWSFDTDAETAARALRPVLEAARDHETVLVLVPSDFRGARLIPEIITRALAAPEFDGVRIGAHLPAELPESRGIAERLIRWAEQRVADGGAPLELTVAFCGIAPRERVASVLSGLPVPTLDGRAARAAQWLRLIKLALDAARGSAAAPGAPGAPAPGASADAAGLGAPRVAVVPIAASEDPHLLAAARELAQERGIGDALTLQLRAGTATALGELLFADGARVRLLLPVVPRREFAGAIDMLLALAAEAADPESALARGSELLEAARAVRGVRAGADPEPRVPGLTRPEISDPADAPDPVATSGPVGDSPASPLAVPLSAERTEFRAAVALAAEQFPATHRAQLRAREWDPSERDSALFYRPPADPERFDTGGLTAAVLGLELDTTGEIALVQTGPPLRVPVVSASGFANEPDTDAVPAENRAWVRRLLQRAAESRGVRGERASENGPPAEYGDAAPSADPASIIDRALTAGEPWRAQPPRERAVRLRRLALATAAARDRFIEVVAAESGDPVPVTDAQVNGAVDAARYLGQLAEGLGAVRGADFRPDSLTLVVADAGAPFDERAEAVLAALAAGSAVLLAVDPSLAASSGALVDEWHAAGLPVGIVGVAPVSGVTAAALAADPRVDRALVLGRRDTALGLIRRRPDIRVEGRFRVPGTVLVSPTADLASAADAAVRSAFGLGAGDARSARVLIVLGSAARVRRFRARLSDAVNAIRVGDTAAPGGQDPLAFDLGPLPQPPTEAGLRALTELDGGEEWLVQPERVDDEGRLWRPGVRTGLRRGARFWREAAGMPVIGLITARTLDEALELQHELGGGGVAALHTGSADDLLPWLERTEAASLVVGRATGPGRIERLPGGGWGEAGMGVQTLAGGPNRLVTLGSWQLREGTPSSTLHLRGLDPEVRILIEAAQRVLDYESFDRVRRAALSDALAWRTSLGRLRDEIGLGVERELLRRWPVTAQIRLAQGGSLTALTRVLAAALLVRAPVTVSTGVVLPAEITDFLASQGIAVSLERDDAWHERIAVEASAAAMAGSGSGSGAGSGSGSGSGSGDGFEPGPGVGLGLGLGVSVPAAGSGDELGPGPLPERVRLIAGDAVRAAEWLGGQSRVAIWAEPVTMAGPVELLAFLREQSISVTAHRYGLLSPPPGLEGWIAELDERVASGR